MPAAAVSKICGAAFEHEPAFFLLASHIGEAERHEVLQFAGSAARSGAWLWRMHLPRSLNGPTPELILRSVQPFQAVNGIGEVAPPLSVSLLPRTPALNKDTGLSGRGLQAHRSRSQGATTSHSAIFASILSHGIAVGRSGVTGMACLPSVVDDVACEDDVLSSRSRIPGCSSSLDAWLDV